jgi:hypothetical protein
MLRDFGNYFFERAWNRRRNRQEIARKTALGGIKRRFWRATRYCEKYFRNSGFSAGFLFEERELISKRSAYAG